MQALSAASGVPVSTIKFYLRDGLLPTGTPTARNQAVYDERHLHRLNLLRVLTKVGGMPIETVRKVIVLLDNPWADPANTAVEVASLAAPPVTVDQVLAAAVELEVHLGPVAMKKYVQAAKLMEQAEIDICEGMDETGPLLTAVLGDALILAVRHELREGRAK